ncbi:MAG: CoA transferase [Solirubrobacterales bacterium]|nr:CoA transferase [Solirubrobacterales bacterium]
MSGAASTPTSDPAAAAEQPLALLEGVKIVAFTTFLVGPAAVQYLADMGADVIKVEEPFHGPHERHWSGADHHLNGESLLFLMSSRNIRSAGLNLKHSEGRAAAAALCRDADVVVSNFRPGVMERLGLGYEDLSRDNEGLIYASASGYGARTAYKHLPGQDLLVQSLSGMPSVTGSAGAPVAAGAVVVDQHAATLLALGIAAALVARARTGKGQEVEVTMIQSALDLQAEVLACHLNGAALERPTGRLATTYHEAPYGFYEVADGWVALSITPMEKISAALGDPPELADLLDPADAFSRREEIYAALSPLLVDHTRADLIDLLRRHDVWCGPVNSYEEALAEPVVHETGAIAEFEHPDAGPVRVVGHPIAFGSGKAVVRRVPPRLGEHTREALAEAGYGAGEIEELETEGVIR